ncbi:protein of unknown function [Moritella yayanosii]|uniref:Uncharacterized protein n=1 Tax=Moritella yayanosii TaxID=69539 RepID=A0A330LWF3_9GAMM|nr:protein of unknown function [Moritella yayanosii]
MSGSISTLITNMPVFYIKIDISTFYINFLSIDRKGIDGQRSNDKKIKFNSPT